MKIVERLEGPGPVAWQVEATLLDECIRTMRLVVSPTRRPDRPEGNAEKSDMAITHAEAMLKSLWRHNRATALEHGRVALAAM